MNLKFKFETYYDESFDLHYYSDIFAVIDRRWFNFLVFLNGGYIYCDDVISFSTNEAKEHFVWLLSKFYPKITVEKIERLFSCFINGVEILDFLEIRHDN